MFAKRKEFYQQVSAQEPKVSSVNKLLLRKRHCALCCANNRACPDHKKKVETEDVAIGSDDPPAIEEPAKAVSPPPSLVTFDADIQPFVPFTIRHDIVFVFSIRHAAQNDVSPDDV